MRGLLCWTCNKHLIGRKRGDEGAFLLREAAMYLELPPAVSALGEERFGRTGRVTKKRRRKSRTTKKRSTR